MLNTYQMTTYILTFLYECFMGVLFITRLMSQVQSNSRKYTFVCVLHGFSNLNSQSFVAVWHKRYLGEVEYREMPGV